MKNRIITISFIAIIIGIFFINLIKKDEEISVLERRKLASFPKISIENIINGKWIDQFEDYTQDQFIGRDNFKNIKAFWSMNVLMQKDNNKMFEKDGALYKMEYPLSETNLRKNTEKINVGVPNRISVESLSDNTVKVNVETLQNGMYFVNIIDGNGNVRTSKVSVMR